MTDHLLIDGRRHPLKRGAYVIGRAPESDILLPEDDAGASRAHARLERGMDGSWTVTDLGSRNGTFVGDEPVAGSRRLTHGDAVRVGRTVIRLDAPPAPAPVAPVPAAAPVTVAAPPEPVRAAASTAEVVPVAPPEDVPAFLRSATAMRLPEPPRADVPAASTAERRPLPPIATPVPAKLAFGEPPSYGAPSSPEPRAGPAAFVDLVPAGIVALAWLMPWLQVNLFGFGGSVSYLDVLSHLGTVLDAGQREPSAFLLLVPLASLVLLAMARVPGVGRFLLIGGGALGTLASSALFVKASSGVNGMSLMSVIGPGVFLYALASLGAIGLGVARIVKGA